MPAFIHDRAEHLLAKNPKMDKGLAFAIATQQSHALGKSPKKHGTVEGKATALKKYPNKKGYVKGANPGNLRTPRLEKRGAGPLDLDVNDLLDLPKPLGQHAPLPKRIGGRKKALLAAGALATGYGAKKLVDASRRPAEQDKLGYATSQYSGPLSYGSFKMESQIPPFRNPRVKTGGPPSQEKKAGIRDAVRGAVGKAQGAARGASRESGEEFTRGALKVVGEAGGDALKKYRGKLIGGAAGLGVAKGAYDAHRDKRVARNITSELRKHAVSAQWVSNMARSGAKKRLEALPQGKLVAGLKHHSDSARTSIAQRRGAVADDIPEVLRKSWSRLSSRSEAPRLGQSWPDPRGRIAASGIEDAIHDVRKSVPKKKLAYDPSPLGNVDMPGMSKMQTPARQLQQSKTVAKIPATKPDAGKAFSTKLPTIGSAV